MLIQATLALLVSLIVASPRPAHNGLQIRDGNLTTPCGGLRLHENIYHKLALLVCKRAFGEDVRILRPINITAYAWIYHSDKDANFNLPGTSENLHYDGTDYFLQYGFSFGGDVQSMDTKKCESAFTDASVKKPEFTCHGLPGDPSIYIGKWERYDTNRTYKATATGHTTYRGANFTTVYDNPYLAFENMTYFYPFRMNATKNETGGNTVGS